MTPELRQLRSFVAVAEAGSLTRAARTLHIAQQSLSQQMRTLELQLGVTLFERSARGTTLDRRRRGAAPGGATRAARRTGRSRRWWRGAG